MLYCYNTLTQSSIFRNWQYLIVSRDGGKGDEGIDEAEGNVRHPVAQIHDNGTRSLAISLQVPFLVINSPNSLDRNVESSDLARSFLTSLILLPLSPSEFLAADLSTRVRGTICSLCTASETVRSSRENFSRKVMTAFSSTVSSSLEKLKRTLICVLFIAGKERASS